MDWKTCFWEHRETVQCYWNNSSWRSNERKFLNKNKESIFAITKKLDFRSMANPKGSWWVTSGTPWFPNWLNAFTACWTLLANAEEISSLIRYISMAFIMIGATVFFNDSSWFYIFKSYVVDLAVHFLATIQMRASSLFEHEWRVSSVVE